MRFALFREVPKRQSRKKRKLNNGVAARKGSDDSDDGDSEDSEDEQGPASVERMTSPAAAALGSTAAPAPPPEDPIWGDESQDVPMTVDDQSATALSGPEHTSNIRPDRFVATPINH